MNYMGKYFDDKPTGYGRIEGIINFVSQRYRTLQQSVNLL
jgi:hypothetical protein